MKKLVIFVVVFILIVQAISAVEIGEIFSISSEPENIDSGVPGVVTYFYSGNKLLASKEMNGQIEYEYQDRLGSDVNTKTLPFGQEISSENRFIFTGKELDSELYYFGARYYDPGLGKFTSVDPVEGNNPYAYVENNPLIYIDPNGLDNYIYYDPEDWSEQAQSAKAAFESEYGETFNLVPVSDLQGFDEALDKADFSGEDDKVLLFFHGDLGKRIWFLNSKQGLAVDQSTIDSRKEETGADYQLISEFFGDTLNGLENLYLYTCEPARGLYDETKPYDYDPNPNIVTEFLNLGVNNVFGGFYWMSYKEKKGVLYPKKGGDFFNRPYEWHKFSLKYVWDEYTRRSELILVDTPTDEIANLYKKYIESL